MQSTSHYPYANPWSTRLATLLLAALVAASASYWVLKWPGPASTKSMPILGPSTPPVDSTKVAKLLGATPGATATVNAAPAIDLQAKYKLQGVIAVGTNSGSALITINGEPAKPYRVGEHLSDDLLLQSVQARSATLATNMQGTGTVTLELPMLPGTSSQTRSAPLAMGMQGTGTGTQEQSPLPGTTGVPLAPTP